MPWVLHTLQSSTSELRTAVGHQMDLTWVITRFEWHIFGIFLQVFSQIITVRLDFELEGTHYDYAV